MNFKRIFTITLAVIQLSLLAVIIGFIHEIRGQKEAFSEDLFDENFFMHQSNEDETPLYSKEEKKTDKSDHKIKLPFSHYVSAIGHALPSTNYVKLHPKISSRLDHFYVVEGQRVVKGMPLFKLDSVDLQKQLENCRAQCQVAKARLTHLDCSISPVDLKKKERDLEELRIKKDLQEKECQIFQTLHKQNVVTESEKSEQEGILRSLLTTLEKESMEYESMKAGPRETERGIFLAELAEKEIGCRHIEAAVEECEVRAPLSGKVLEINAVEGQIVSPKAEPILVLGDDEVLHLYVRIDESQAWRIIPGKKLKAVAVHKGNPQIHFVLDFVRVRPRLQSKKGTRNLELVFAFEKGKHPIYLEEQFDVYIEAADQTDTSCLDYQFSQRRSQ